MVSGSAYSVAVAGASGYAGGELCRLLAGHPGMALRTVCADSSVGDRLTDHHRHLTGLDRHVLEPTDVATLSGHDVVFLALPHGHSSGLARDLPPSTLVVDLGPDHRLSSATDWTRWYGGPYAQAWTYGMPELPGKRDKLVGARRIAVPGCYPTAAILALGPGLTADLVDPDVVIVAASGSSGAGRMASRNLLGSEVMGAVSAYGVGGLHRHTPEITEHLSDAAGVGVRVSFTPMLAPMPRGILATCSAPLRGGVGADSARSVYERAYSDEPFVSLLPEGVWPSTAAVIGSNSVHLQVTVDSDASRLVVIAAVDNLTKGTAGAAIQSANLALGLEESLGLSRLGLAP